MIIKSMTSIHRGDNSNFMKQHKLVSNLGRFLLWGIAGFSYEGQGNNSEGQKQNSLAIKIRK
jgi:hypothetical protein